MKYLQVTQSVLNSKIGEPADNHGARRQNWFQNPIPKLSLLKESLKLRQTSWELARLLCWNIRCKLTCNSGHLAYKYWPTESTGAMYVLKEEMGYQKFLLNFSIQKTGFNSFGTNILWLQTEESVFARRTFLTILRCAACPHGFSKIQTFDLSDKAFRSKQTPN